MTVDFKKEFTLSLCHQLDFLCSPLKKNCITFFAYSKIQDNKCLWLCNHEAWSEYFINKHYYQIIDKVIPRKNGRIVWQCLQQNPMFNDAKAFFNIQNGAVIIKAEKTIIERFFFATTENNDRIYEIYHFMPEVLDRFILYFKAKMADRLKVCEKFMLSLNETYQDEMQLPDMAKFVEETPIDRYLIGEEETFLYLTKTEACVFSLLKEGLSYKEIAKKLSMSQETVKSHQKKIKDKFAMVYPHSRRNHIHSTQPFISAKTLCL